VRFIRVRKRYERRGVLVDETAPEEAERRCLEDADARARRREREYDALLMTGVDRYDARDAVRDDVAMTLTTWRAPRA
jgi:hypothetical protein